PTYTLPLHDALPISDAERNSPHGLEGFLHGESQEGTVRIVKVELLQQQPAGLTQGLFAVQAAEGAPVTPTPGGLLHERVIALAIDRNSTRLNSSHVK